MSPTRIMNEVCQQCFSGNWEEMIRFAREYDPANRVALGKIFRDIIGTRNRTSFWEDVAAREPLDSSTNAVDGDSIAGLSKAIANCSQGISTLIAIRGRLIGSLVPLSESGAAKPDHENS